MSRPEVRSFVYTKSNGERSNRRVLIMSKPSHLYLGVEVDGLTPQEIEDIQTAIEESRKEISAIMEYYNAPWKSFKPEGIEWEDE